MTKVFEDFKIDESQTSQSNINRCLTCKHWEQNTFYDHENAINYGICCEIDSELEIEIKTGGYVKQIETKSTFACILHDKI